MCSNPVGGSRNAKIVNLFMFFWSISLFLLIFELLLMVSEYFFILIGITKHFKQVYYPFSCSILPDFIICNCFLSNCLFGFACKFINYFNAIKLYRGVNFITPVGFSIFDLVIHFFVFPLSTTMNATYFYPA